MRHMAVVLASNFVPTLAAVGVSAVEPGRAEAANTVKSCTGGDVRLSAAEKQMLELHNKERASRDLPRLCVHPKLQKAANAHSRDMDPARPLHPRQRRPAPQEVRLPVARLRRELLPGRRPSLARDDLQGLDAKLLPQIKHPRPQVRRGRRRRRYRRRQRLENNRVDRRSRNPPLIRVPYC